MKYSLNTGERDFGFSKIDFRKDLNDEQYSVVTEADGPCLVLAGAGSGKTRTLVYRVAYLLSMGVPAENILLVTFTNKAAHTMQDRVEMLLKAKPKNLWSGTFHHIGNRSLHMYAKEVGYKSDFGILDEDDALGLIKICIKSVNLKATEERFPTPKIIKSVISLALNTCRPIEKILEQNYPYFLIYTYPIKKIAEEYELRKHQANVMDYDDLLTKWLHLLQSVQSVREKFSQQFKYVLVDEYQDTNKLQAEIIKALSSHYKNVLVVGDDAQAIYSFRGAEVSNILNFQDFYPKARIFKLETNYRSTPEVLDLANSSIMHNSNQYEKRLKPVNDHFSKPALIQVTDMHAQASFVAQRALELRDEGIPLKDIAVLFRAHYQSAELEMELIKRNIPYIIRGGVRFFEQAHIKDVLAYVRIITNPMDELAWVRALSQQPGIGPGYAQKVFTKFLETGNLDNVCSSGFGRNLPARVFSGLNGFKRILSGIVDKELLKSPDEIIRKIIDSGYEAYARLHFENAKDRIDDLHELVNFAHQYKSMNVFLQDISLRESFKGETIRENREDEEYIVLSTIHQAKGLEWNSVFLIGLCEGQFPHSKSLDDPRQIEEERRLFYVAATRAKNDLYLIHPITRYDYQMGTVISRKSVFLQELDQSVYEKWEIEESGLNYEPIIDL